MRRWAREGSGGHHFVGGRVVGGLHASSREYVRALRGVDGGGWVSVKTGSS